MTLLSHEGWLLLLRWIHFLAGITWIGLLYYFNLVQVPFFGETEAPVRVGAQQKLLPRALWWFRWGAMFTFLAGWIYFFDFWLARMAEAGAWVILVGAILGTVMWANVWFVIWPKNQIVIQNAIDTGAGKPANPAAAPAGARGGLASRTNVLLSIPMLLMMGSASHSPLPRARGGGAAVVFWIVTLLIIALVEANALWGKPGQGAAKPLATIKGTLWAGFILTAVFYLWFEIASRL
jgi:uncharacterized membrane protein